MLRSISTLNGPEIVEKLLDLCFPVGVSVLDVTWGRGGFWKQSERRVLGCDRKPVADVCCDFRALPFAAGSFNVVVFDPPFQAWTSGKMIEQYSGYRNGHALKAAVSAGLREAWRVSRLGVLYKCQDYVNSRRVLWMTFWAYDVLGEPYELVDRLQSNPKLKAVNWGRQQSAWRNHATFMVWTRKNRRVPATRLDI